AVTRTMPSERVLCCTEESAANRNTSPGRPTISHNTVARTRITTPSHSSACSTFPLVWWITRRKPETAALRSMGTVGRRGLFAECADTDRNLFYELPHLRRLCPPKNERPQLLG